MVLVACRLEYVEGTDSKIMTLVRILLERKMLFFSFLVYSPNQINTNSNSFCRDHGLCEFGLIIKHHYTRVVSCCEEPYLWKKMQIGDYKIRYEALEGAYLSIGPEA